MRAVQVLLPRENAGVAAIEFALYGMVFLMLVAGTVDVGLLLFTSSQLDAAVSAGAEYAVNNATLVGSAPATLNSNISSVVDNAVGTGWATSTVNVNNSNDSTHCYCPSVTAGTVTWGTAQSTSICGTACPSGSGVYGQFVSISASRTISPLFATFGFVPSGTLTRSAVVETE